MIAQPKAVICQASRVAWETTMDCVAVCCSFFLRHAVYVRNGYADSYRLCAQLEAIRRRREHAVQLDYCLGDSCEATLLDDDVFVIDARREDEYYPSHLYSAVNCHYARIQEIEAIFAEYGVTKDQFIVVYCAVGLRSGYMVTKLRKMGYKRACVLFGGYYHWVNSGFPIYNGHGRAYEVLPQHLPASLLLPAHLIKDKIEEKARE